MTVAEQARVLLAMMLCGAGAGALNDLLAAFRRNAVMTAAADLALGILGALGMIAAALLLRCEPFRLYAFLGVIAGWAIYAASLGTIVRLLKKEFISLSRKVTKIAKRSKNMQEK